MTQLVSLFVFILLAIFAWWSITGDLSKQNAAQPDTAKRYVKLFINDFEITAMDENGKPDYILHGKHLQQFSDSEDTEIEQPIFLLLQDKGQWKISADTAIFNDRTETIRLKDNVLMQQQNIEPAVNISTQTLLIHTKTHIAETKSAVDIMRGHSHLKSNGMIFNNNTSELELSPNVKGHYLPHD